MRTVPPIFFILACVCYGRRVKLWKSPEQSVASAFHLPGPAMRLRSGHSTHGTTQPEILIRPSPARWNIADRSFTSPMMVADEFKRCSRRQGISAFVSCSLMGSPLASLAATLDLSTTLDSLQQQERTVEDLFTKATPSVVFITTYRKGLDEFTMNPVETPQGTGSGFVWDNDGHIVTNYHVVKGASEVKVAVTKDPRKKPKTFIATLVGYNPDKDVAVLQIGKTKLEEKALTPISIGSSGNLRVGATALAIGNPFGFDHTLTVGVVSGLGREVTSVSGRPIRNVIQTDAAINPGNSGGALLDSSGRLIGMNTAIYSPSGASAGIGFAIPVDTLKQQVETLIRDGKVIRASIGVSILEGSQAQALGIQRGVLVLDVPRGSNAAKAGVFGTSRDRFTGEIILGDVIVAVNGKSLENEADLYKALDRKTPGQEVMLTIVRLESTPTDIVEKEVQISLVLTAQEAK